MKLKSLAWLAGLILCSSCMERDANQDAQNAQSEWVFDKEKWKMRDGNGYAYRDKMLHDVVYNLGLKGMPKDTLIALLGEPDRKDFDHLFYAISSDQIMLLTLHSKTLVIKLDKNGLVEWRKIHE